MGKLKPKNIDEYISSFPEEVKNRLIQIRETILTTFPAVEESIRYAMPAFKINKRHIYFSGYKNHIGMYPVYGMESIEDELSEYRGKGTKDSLHFTHDRKLPIGLIKKIVKLMAARKQ